MSKKNKKSSRILIVDDDTSVIASIELLLKQHSYQTISASTQSEAMNALAENQVDLIIQDMNFSRSTSGEEGLQLLKQIKNCNAAIPVVLMTAWGSIELAVKGIKYGADDFVTKPWDNQQLLRTIETCVNLNQPYSNQPISRAELNKRFDFNSIIGEDPLMLEVLSTIGRVAPTDAAILILGESGTGKELIADAIHRNSSRCEQDLVKVNLGGMTSSLFESEMFGHVKGAFTDAKQDRQGRFEMADNGTIFLDEIGDLDPSSQVKLLRILQDQSFQAVGSSITRRSNFRVISATNRSLEEMVKNNQFREDLLYRLNLITIELPPLRKRQGDIPLLTEQHLKRVEKLYKMQDLSIEDEALKWLQQQPWPGNIRQLTQTIERTVLISSSQRLSAQDFISNNENSTSHNDSIYTGNLTLDEVEKLMIVKALDAYQQNITKVAQGLGISRAALYRRLEKYGINQ